MGANVRVVFMADSITEGWRDKAPAFFGPGRVGRGISGQTTPQMLLRFRQDVIALHPTAVHIMAGTNDIAGNTGPMTLAETQGQHHVDGAARARQRHTGNPRIAPARGGFSVATGGEARAGVHSEASGYAVMAPFAEAGIAKIRINAGCGSSS